MSKVLPFKKRSLADKHKGKGLCRSGFHQWVASTSTPFDVKKGKLVTRDVCSRCGKIRTRTK